MKLSVKAWQVAGFLFTAIAGTLLHFLYDWSGQSVLIAPFSAVNESIWEHIKLLFFPMLLFAAVESRFLPGEYPHFWCAKLLGITAGLLLIPVLYYTYTGALGISADWFNITIFFIAAGATYSLETWLLQTGRPACPHPAVAVLLLLLIAAFFVLFTFSPPQIPLFQDPITGLYGRISL